MTYVPTLPDVVLLYIVAIFMAIEVRVFGRLGRPAARGARPDARMRAYAFLIAYQWALVASVVMLWYAARRPWSTLLLGTPSRWGFAAGLILAATYIVLAVMQIRVVASRPGLSQRLRAQFAEIESIVPHTPRERRLWTFAAITAGCCEEVLFRGFLLAFVASFAGLVAAVAISSVLFGLFHAYYGWRGILKTGAFGLVMAIIAVGSASLIPVIIIHATVDLASGHLGYLTFSNDQVAVDPSSAGLGGEGTLSPSPDRG